MKNIWTKEDVIKCLCDADERREWVEEFVFDAMIRGTNTELDGMTFALIPCDSDGNFVDDSELFTFFDAPHGWEGCTFINDNFTIVGNLT